MRIKVLLNKVRLFLLTDISFVKKSTINLVKMSDQIVDMTISEDLYLRKLELELDKLSISLSKLNRLKLLRLKKENKEYLSQYDILKIIFPAKYNLLKYHSSNKNCIAIEREYYQKELKICSYIHNVLISLHSIN